MDTLGILFVMLVFVVIAVGAIRGKNAKKSQGCGNLHNPCCYEDDKPGVHSGVHYGGPYESW